MGRWRRGHLSRPGLFWVMGNGENNVSPIFHLTNRWKEGEGGSRERGWEKEKEGLGAGKKRNRGHWSSSSLYHTGGLVGFGFTYMSISALCRWIYVFRRENTISRGDRRKNWQLIEHLHSPPVCPLILLPLTLHLFLRQRGCVKQRRDHSVEM